MSIDLPIAGKVGFQYNREKDQMEYIYEFKNFPPNTNKIESIGIIRKHKMLVECDDKGGFNNKEIKTVEDRLRTAKKLRDKNLITEKEYQKKREEILESL